MLAGGVRLGVGLGPDLAGLVLGLALDVGGAGFGGLDDRAHLLAGGRGERFAAAPGGALELVDLVGESVQMAVNRLRVVAPPPDGEVLLLDALSVQRHWNYLRLGWEKRPQPSERGGAVSRLEYDLRRPPDPAGA